MLRCALASYSADLQDDRRAAAEKKKQLVRMEISELRKEFQFLLKRNAQLDKSQQLPREGRLCCCCCCCCCWNHAQHSPMMTCRRSNSIPSSESSSRQMSKRRCCAGLWRHTTSCFDELQLQIDAVRAELAWVSEKHTLALEKLRNKVTSFCFDSSAQQLVRRRRRPS